MTTSPWLKFYPTDWRADPALRVCSLAARGLWMEMLCVMHEAQPRGYLKINGISLANNQIAALVGAPLRDVQACLDELEVAGVYSQDNSGIFSRRMVRDTRRAAEDKTNGKGGGNPGLKGGVNPPDNPDGSGGVKPGDKAQKLEARSQKPEEIKPPPTEAPPNKPNDGLLALAVAAFNRAASDAEWPQVQRLTASRKTNLRARLAECGTTEREQLDGWGIAIAKARDSPFLCGDNDRGWKADFDFLCKTKNFTKLMEGGYDRRTGSANGHAGKPHDAILGALASIVAEGRGSGERQAGADGQPDDPAG